MGGDWPAIAVLLGEIGAHCVWRIDEDLRRDITEKPLHASPERSLMDDVDIEVAAAVALAPNDAPGRDDPDRIDLREDEPRRFSKSIVHGSGQRWPPALGYSVAGHSVSHSFAGTLRLASSHSAQPLSTA